MRLRHYLVSTIRARTGRRTNTAAYNLYGNNFLWERDGVQKCQVRGAHIEKSFVPFAPDVLQSFIVMLLSRFDVRDWDEIAGGAARVLPLSYTRPCRVGDARRHKLFSFHVILINNRLLLFNKRKLWLLTFQVQVQWLYVGFEFLYVLRKVCLAINWQVNMCSVLYLLLCEWIATAAI